MMVRVALILLSLSFCQKKESPTFENHYIGEVKTQTTGQLVPDGRTLHALSAPEMKRQERWSTTYRYVPEKNGSLVFFNIKASCGSHSLVTWMSHPDGSSTETQVVKDNVPIDTKAGFEYFFELSLEVECEPASAEFLVSLHEQGSETAHPSTDPTLPTDPVTNSNVSESVTYSIKFKGRPSNKDSCTVSFVWTKTGNLGLSSSSSERMLKVVEKTNTFSMDLVWLPFSSETLLEKALKTLQDQKTITVGTEQDCSDEDTITIPNSQNLVFFTDDEKVILDPSFAKDSEVWKPEASVAYSYHNPRTAYWSIKVKHDLGIIKSASLRLFSKRSRSYLTESLSIPVSQITKDTIELKVTNKSVVRQILANQASIDLLLRIETHLTANESSTLHKKTLRVGDLLLKYRDLFTDHSNPGKDPFTILESDINL